MIGITISGNAYAAIAATLPDSSVDEKNIAPDAEYRIWLPSTVVERLFARRERGETFSNVILRLVERGCMRRSPVNASRRWRVRRVAFASHHQRSGPGAEPRYIDLRLIESELQHDSGSLFLFRAETQSQFGDQAVISFQQDRNGFRLEVSAFAEHALQRHRANYPVAGSARISQPIGAPQ
jgi:hypothetical protein